MLARREGTSGVAHALGIDLGGTSVRTAVYDDRWNLLECTSLPTRVAQGPDAVMGDIASCVRALTGKFGFRPAAIGLGSPGPLDLNEGRLLRLPNFPGWDFFPIREALSEATGIPVVLESDANAAALAEWRHGAGALCQVDSMCMLTLGTGVGGGLILARRIWHGRDGMAGELGHVCLNPDGPACPCGGRGCLERYASATAIVAAGREWLNRHEPAMLTPQGSPDMLTTKRMAEMADEGHAGMKLIFEDVGRYLGLSIAGVIGTLDLPLYVLGGGVAEAWPLFAPAMFRTIFDYSYVYQLSQPTQTLAPEPGKPFITRALLGPQAGLLGAAMISLLEQPATAPAATGHQACSSAVTLSHEARK